MEMFTSQDPEFPEQMTDVTYPQEDQVQITEEIQNQDLVENQVPETIPLERSESLEASLFSDQSQDNEQLVTIQEIRDLLKDYLVEETTEETTDYVKLLYEGQKLQGEDIKVLRKEVEVSVKDQQTIGLLSVGATVLLIGALTVFIFLGRIR